MPNDPKDYPPWRSKGGIVAYKITEDCVNCGGCIDECPEGAIIEGDEISSIDPEKCVECGTCVDAFFCPAGAIIPGQGNQKSENIEREIPPEKN